PAAAQKPRQCRVEKWGVLVGMKHVDAPRPRCPRQTPSNAPIATGSTPQAQHVDPLFAELFPDGADRVQAKNRRLDLLRQATDDLPYENLRPGHLHFVDDEPDPNPSLSWRYRGQAVRPQSGRLRPKNLCSDGEHRPGIRRGGPRSWPCPLQRAADRGIGARSGLDGASVGHQRAVSDSTRWRINPCTWAPRRSSKYGSSNTSRDKNAPP